MVEVNMSTIIIPDELSERSRAQSAGSFVESPAGSLTPDAFLCISAGKLAGLGSRTHGRGTFSTKNTRYRPTIEDLIKN